MAGYQQLGFRFSGKWCTILLMRKILVSVIWLSCSLMALGQAHGQFYNGKTSVAHTYTDPDVYLVYSVVINYISKLPIYPFLQATEIVIDDQTATGQHPCAPPNKEHKALLASAIADYAKANKVPHRLLPRFDLDKPYQLVQRSPEAIYLSGIGFNRDKTVAVLTAFAGNGADYVLIKKDGKWQFLEGWSDYGCAWAS